MMSFISPVEGAWESALEERTALLKALHDASGHFLDVAMKAQVWGALSLYLNFVNLFQLLLSLFGQREE